MNEIADRVQKYIVENHLIEDGDSIIIGLSGGADSVCLFRILLDISMKMNIKLIAVHVNHGIRGDKALEDEMFSQDLCAKYNIPFKSFHVDIPKICVESHETEEECGRRIRYEIFGKEASNINKSKIAVAHHINDQVETIIFRILRGTGIKGISGMKPQNGKIIRPLLCLEKREIIEYLEDCKQDYKLDGTNEDTDYARNYIRKVILPEFEKVNENSNKHIISLSEEALEIEKYLEEEVDSILNNAIDESGKYKVNIINEAKPVIRKIVIRRIISSYGISLKDITRDHIRQIENIISKKEAREVHLPNDVIVRNEASYLSVIKCKNQNIANDFHIELSVAGDYIIPKIGRLKCSVISDFNANEFPESLYTKWFDYDKILDDLCVRTRRAGDYIIINREGKRKSLKDYMIDMKIPKSERDTVPIICCGSRVIWVVGYRIAEDVKITDQTKQVVEIVYTKEKQDG